MLTWNQHIGQTNGTSMCLCCHKTMIQQSSFHCGHVIAAFAGGQQTVVNLRPICPGCNGSMGVMHMGDFQRRHGFSPTVD